MIDIRLTKKEYGTLLQAIETAIDKETEDFDALHFHDGSIHAGNTYIAKLSQNCTNRWKALRDKIKGQGE